MNPLHPQMLAPLRLPRILGGLSLAALLAQSVVPASADDASPSRVNALVGFTFADEYVTPRGMIVQDEGLTFQLLTLGLINVHKGGDDAFLSDVTIVGGFWNDYATSPMPKHLEGGGTTNWIEIDPILGASFSFAKHLKLDVTYTAFGMQILDIGTSQHLETKLSFEDTSLLGKFALHPYLLYWVELDGKATAAANFGVPEGTYLEIGVAPSFTIGDAKVEFPARMLLPDEDFYGETFGEKSSAALYEIGIKISGSAAFMPSGYGHWGWNVGVKYMDFLDDNLKQLATSGGFGSPTEDTTQIFGGFSTFF